MKPNEYRLGEYIWKIETKEPGDPDNDMFYCEETPQRLYKSDLIKMGAVSVKSKQIEKLERIKKALDVVQIDTDYNLNKIRKLVDHLQKG